VEEEIRIGISQLNEGLFIEEYLSLGHLKLCLATKNESVFELQNEYPNQPKYFIIPDKMWLLKYLANPPLSFYNWWTLPEETTYKMSEFINVSHHLTFEELEIYLGKEDFIYSLLKRLRLPLIGVKVSNIRE
jgi:hypothetical protein